VCPGIVAPRIKPGGPAGEAAFDRAARLVTQARRMVDEVLAVMAES